ncbi:hypothetical protein ACHHYP_03970 [Achlya hypogyna]|uniref:Dynein attachment factor N-terminal domain-containing protein n=1 Tax=Achlya hypogyna TaxID=1202772 RepID=A0A1V9Z2T7_ACHHY|nr:hypothetical protein ACHHYP_03970 [Achlya hypogyna]
MASIYSGAFDTASLQKELVQALEEDRKYKATDEMKKRAIHTASSYDEFKNFVLCADLKPVSSKELQNLSKSERQRNRLYHKKAASVRATTGTLTGSNDSRRPPKSSVEFLRTWKRSCTSDAGKYEYLVLTSPARLGKLFQAEMDADLFADIVACLTRTMERVNPNNEIDDYEAEQAAATVAIGVLEAVATTSRLELMLSFLSTPDTMTLHRLVQLIEGITVAATDEKTQAETCSRIRAAFNMP